MVRPRSLLAVVLGLWTWVTLAVLLPHVQFPFVDGLKNPTQRWARQFVRKMIVMREGNKVTVSEDLADAIESGPIPLNERCFVINGWRWHTASVIRDLERFRTVVRGVKYGQLKQQQFDSASAAKILGCFQFVCGFNWKALMKVEAEIFFPWLQKLLPDNHSAVSLMTDIVQQHSTIISLWDKMETQCRQLSSSAASAPSSSHGATTSQQQADGYNRIEELIVDMQACALKIQSVQESLFVPYISAFVSKKEQEVFNRMVIKRLGLLDSQVHLVSMHDAIKAIPKELRLFEEQIPAIARAVLPVWRKRLYLPKAACLISDA